MLKLDTKEKIATWLNWARIKKYTITDDLIVNVDGDVNIPYLEEQVLPVSFGTVKGNFNCSQTNLKTLQGCPKIIAQDFNCASNQALKTLLGGPEYVDGNYICSFNDLHDVKGIALRIGWNFLCHKNPALEYNLALIGDKVTGDIAFSLPEHLNWWPEYRDVDGDIVMSKEQFLQALPFLEQQQSRKELAYKLTIELDKDNEKSVLGDMSQEVSKIKI